eukprot:TRINITY_DN3809_c0_g1_i3.p1 TRINITY_DN3809_c0_g1~~TRINITY_DN3809_c0_g1_i3.p1  ORF type:complete len:254 (+),score=79.51 TRINITY_DN3809_c0_g1_i3:82-843(+)
MIRRPPRSTLSSSSAASDVYKRQGINAEYGRIRSAKLMVTDTQIPTYRLTERKGFLEIEIELPLVESASDIDAYSENQVLELTVENLYALQLPLAVPVDDDDLCCKWSNRTHTLTITLPTSSAAESSSEAPVSEQCFGISPEEECFGISSKDVPEVIQLEKQDIQRDVEPGAAPATVCEETGVSDFSIFKHDLQTELDAIYDATRSRLPTIQDSDSDSEEEVELVDVSAQLAALSKRTYELSLIHISEPTRPY